MRGYDRLLKARVLIAAVACALVMLSSAIGVAVLAGPGGGERPPEATPKPGLPPPPDDAVKIPELSPDQKLAIRAIALGDARVLALTGSLPTVVDDVVLWHHSNGTIIGGVVTIKLATRTTIDGEWLAKKPAADPTRRLYDSFPWRGKWANVGELVVFVDVNIREVVKIRPGEGARLLSPAPPELLATPDPEGSH